MKRFATLLRRTLFALAALVVFLALATWLLTFLESRGVVQTERPDDRVSYLRNEWLRQQGDYFVLDDPSMLYAAFPVRKARETVRLVMTGESFMKGSPWIDQHPNVGGIPDWLAAELPLRYPSRRFEVINAAAGGQNSFRIRDIVEDLVKVKPDLIIVGVGNNEGYVPPTSANRPLHKWIVYRLLKRILLPNPRPEERPYFAPQDQTAVVENNYHENMSAIVETCRRAHVRLMLIALPINWKFNRHDLLQGYNLAGDPSQDEDVVRACQLIGRGDFAQAETLLIRSKTRGAALYYLGRIYEIRGIYARAREYYRRYVEMAPENRTRPSFNRFVRRLAREKKLPLVDLEAYADSIAVGGVTDPSLWYDYCHMSKRGYYMMAREIARALIDQQIFPAAPNEPRPALTREQLINSDRRLSVLKQSAEHW